MSENQESKTIEMNIQKEVSQFSPMFDPGKLLNMLAKDMTAEQAAAAWSMLDLMESVASARKEQIRERVFELAVDKGVPDENGTYRAFIEGTKLGKRKNVSTKPEEKGLKKLLEELKIPILEVYDSVQITQLNMTKLEYLVETGRIPKDRVEALKKVTYTIELEPSPEVSDYLDRAKSTLAGLPPKAIGRKRT